MDCECQKKFDFRLENFNEFVIKNEINLEEGYWGFFSLGEIIFSRENVCIRKDMIAQFVANGLDPRKKNWNKENYLHTFIIYVQPNDYDAVSIAEILLSAGVDIEVPDGYGLTPLQRCIYKEHKPLTKFLIDRGANVDSQSTRDFWSPVHNATVIKNFELAKILIENGANIKARCSRKLTPLHIACICENAEMIRLFLRSGADVTCVEESGNIPPMFLVKTTEIFFAYVFGKY